MLIVEKTSNGRTIVTIKRDWHIGRLGIAYVQKQRSVAQHNTRTTAPCKPTPV